MQMRAFRGSRTVMSLRLCSRAPWTTSSSAAIGKAIVSIERVFVQGSRVAERGRPGKPARMATVARRTAVATLVAGGIVVLGLALWKIKLVLALLFFAFIIAAAIRPSIEWLARHRVPQAARPRPPLRRVPRRDRGRAGLRRACGATPGRPRAQPERQGRDRPGGAQLARRQAPGARRSAEAPQAPAGAKRPGQAGHAGRHEGVRGDRRDLLHLRGRRVLDLRARQDDRPRHARSCRDRGGSSSATRGT